MNRKIHLCHAIYRTRKGANTYTGNVTATVTWSGGFENAPATAMEACTSGTVDVLDMSPRRDDEIIGWQPVCGAPIKAGFRPRRFSDGVTCKRCPTTRRYRDFHKRRDDAA